MELFQRSGHWLIMLFPKGGCVVVPRKLWGMGRWSSMGNRARVRRQARMPRNTRAIFPRKYWMTRWRMCWVECWTWETQELYPGYFPRIYRTRCQPRCDRVWAYHRIYGWRRTSTAPLSRAPITLQSRDARYTLYCYRLRGLQLCTLCSPKKWEVSPMSQLRHRFWALVHATQVLEKVKASWTTNKFAISFSIRGSDVQYNVHCNGTFSLIIFYSRLPRRFSAAFAPAWRILT